MSEKRRDQRGRILKTGESHRKDGLYMFRYTDTRKQRRYIYARSLEELRRKETEIQRDLADGIDYAAGEMTVLELVTRYMDLKRTLKENSYRAYDTVINRMRKDPFSQKQIRQIKPSDARPGSSPSMTRDTNRAPSAQCSAWSAPPLDGCGRRHDPQTRSNSSSRT